LWLSQSQYGTSDYPTVSATIQNVEGGLEDVYFSTLSMLRRAA
jgi:hypothetical protein